MSDEQINAAIAQACGYECREPYAQGWVLPNKTAWQLTIPNYCTDLNAMHDAEILIQDRNKYLNILASVTEPIDSLPKDHDWAFTQATARQRAEAFLRTLGKWEEVQG